MSDETTRDDHRGLKAPGTTFMIAGGLIGAVGAYVFQVYGGRALGTEAFAPVGLLWTAFFILATVLLVPVEQYVTREVATGRKAFPHDLRPIATIGVIGAVIGGVFVYLTPLFGHRWQYVAQMALLMIGYALLFVGKGVLAGKRRFADVGWVLIVETVVRLVAGIVAIELVASAESLGWAMVLGGFAVLGLRWWRYDSGDDRAPVAPASRFLGGYVGATASSQILLGGAPIAVAALGGDPTMVSVVFATFTLFRAPLTLIFSLQGRILPYLVALAGSGDKKTLGRFSRLVVIFGAVLSILGGVVGWLIGPAIVSVLFEPDWAPSSLVAAMAAAGVMAAAAAQIASQVLVAEGRTSRLTLAWMSGLVVALMALLALGGEPDVRVAIAFALGEATAFILMALLTRRSEGPVLQPETGWESPTELDGNLRESVDDDDARALNLGQARPE
jgi:O-antigen/teichoic acid export membrane protein